MGGVDSWVFTTWYVQSIEHLHHPQSVIIFPSPHPVELPNASANGERGPRVLLFHLEAIEKRTDGPSQPIENDSPSDINYISCQNASPKIHPFPPLWGFEVATCCNFSASIGFGDDGKGALPCRILLCFISFDLASGLVSCSHQTPCKNGS